jgi:hypothetical protein
MMPGIGTMAEAMTIQDFIPIWQAQPFRAFRVHTARGEFVVTYPMAAALTPFMRVALVVNDTRVETFALEEIDRCEPFGPSMSVVEAISAIQPEKLANDAQLIFSAAQTAAAAEFSEQPSRTFDSGTVALAAEHTSNGVHTVQAIVKTRDGETVAGGHEVVNPCLTDTATSEVLFDLLLTDWDATCRQEDRVWHVSLRHASNPDATSIGMMQSVIRRVRGVPWLLEEIPRWFAKGLLLPDGG